MFTTPITRNEKNAAALNKIFPGFATAGCGSHGGPRDLMMEEAASGQVERPVAMKGETTFLEGKLTATATVSRGFDRGRPRPAG